MNARVIELPDAKTALETARPFLEARPIEHNLLLTILAQSIEFALGGRFWLVANDSETIGFALESPVGMGAVLTPMPASASRLLADAIAAPLPHMQSEAGTAAAFAGRWTERHGTAIRQVEGGRLYELMNLKPVPSVGGTLRLAGSDDRAILVEWSRLFIEEAGVVPQNVEEAVDRRLARDQFWVWDDNGIASMAAASAPAAGVVRVSHVYTPIAHRGAGYATACVEGMSRVLIDRGSRCILYTDLANPTSNSIYRRIGYEAVAEVLVYKFA